MVTDINISPLISMDLESGQSKIIDRTQYKIRNNVVLAIQAAALVLPAAAVATHFLYDVCDVLIQLSINGGHQCMLDNFSGTHQIDA